MEISKGFKIFLAVLLAVAFFCVTAYFVLLMAFPPAGCRGGSLDPACHDSSEGFAFLGYTAAVFALNYVLFASAPKIARTIIHFGYIGPILLIVPFLVADLADPGAWIPLLMIAGLYYLKAPGEKVSAWVMKHIHKPEPSAKIGS